MCVLQVYYHPRGYLCLTQPRYPPPMWIHPINSVEYWNLLPVRDKEICFKSECMSLWSWLRRIDQCDKTVNFHLSKIPHTFGNPTNIQILHTLCDNLIIGLSTSKKSTIAPDTAPAAQELTHLGPSHVLYNPHHIPYFPSRQSQFPLSLSQTPDPTLYGGNV